MNGLEAISSANGWAIAFVGITIVFTGLVLLALFISQLHRLIKAWDERCEYTQRIVGKWKKRKDPLEAQEKASQYSVLETARQAKVIIQFLGEPFSLSHLLEIAKSCDMYRPHSSINDLVCHEYILPDGRGFFRWNSEKT